MKNYQSDKREAHRIVVWVCGLVLTCVMTGCDPDSGGRSSGSSRTAESGGTNRTSGGSLAELFGGGSRSSREIWTIECNAFEGKGRRETADRLATMLKKVDRIDARRVSVEHGEQSSKIFYGEYPLRYVEARTDGKEKTRGDLVIELSDEIKRDLRFIRELAFGEQYPFFSARMIPKPESFVGKPEWDLKNAKGVYTLNVGVTYPTATLHDYKQAAYLWVEDLRKRGYEAYYYFATDKSQASICVGTFGEDAFVIDPSGRRGYSPKVKSLQAREEFKYNLENGHPVYNLVRNPETNRREKIPNYSFLARIPRPEPAPRRQ
ncbi:MAG: hypothetical protein KF841_04490 [Phycisphaerae bacterium]|nr:hypothetical protein [Phycisphaerae bacterium]